jgi:hypothetical protein
MEERRFVLVKGTGGAGLGDLLRAVLAGLHYAVVSRRHLAVRWDDGLYGDPGVNVFPLLFTLHGFDPLPDGELDSLSVHPLAWAGRLGATFGSVYKSLRSDEWNRSWALENLSFDQAKYDYQARVLVMWEFDRFEAGWEAAHPGARYGSTPKEALSYAAARHLQPTEHIRSFVSTFRSEKLPGPSIGVHIRQTLEKGGTTRHLPLKKVFEAVDLLKEEEPAASIFLAADNSAVEQRFRGHFPNVVTTRKWMPDPGQPLHFSASRADRLKRAREACVDMHLLASCNYLIYPALSSFGQTARIFSGLPDERVIALRSHPTLAQRVGAYAARFGRSLT